MAYLSTELLSKGIHTTVSSFYSIHIWTPFVGRQTHAAKYKLWHIVGLQETTM